MKFSNRFKKLFLAGFVLLLSLPTFATDGYFGLGYGARQKGLAGAGIGYYRASLINANPAGYGFLDKSFSVGVALFSPIRQYTVVGNPSGLPGTFGLTPGTVESETNIFVIPNFSGNWRIDEKNAFAVSIFGNGGMNTDYPSRTFHDQNAERTGVDLAQLFANFSYSRKLSEQHSLGITGILGYQRFETSGLSNFAPFSSDATLLTNNGDDNSFGVGFKIGYMGTLTDGLSLGVVYQSKIFMSKFEDYAGLFAEQGAFDIPASWAVGLVYEPSEKLRLLFDVKQILYSGVPAIANPIDARALPPAFLNPGGDPNNPMDYTPNPNYVPLGADNGSGFGWEDMLTFKVGAEYEVNEKWMVRGGFSYGKQPVPESEVVFNILAPGIIENHLALGFSRTLNNNKRIDFSFNYAFNNSVTGFNPFDFDAAQAMQGNFVPNQTVKLEMKQFDFEVNFVF